VGFLSNEDPLATFQFRSEFEGRVSLAMVIIPKLYVPGDRGYVQIPELDILLSL
jgi:hypothetical protein